MAPIAVILVVVWVVIFFGGGLWRTRQSLTDWRPGQASDHSRHRAIAWLWLATDAVFLLGPTTAMVGIIPMADWPVIGHGAGIPVFLVFAALGAWAQREMGQAWAPVGASDRLITSGPFAHVRNPIYTGLVGKTIGIALLAPTALTVTGVALAVLTTELQVRRIEEPHLLNTHAPYRGYSESTGRFVPRVGMLRRPKTA